MQRVVMKYVLKSYKTKIVQILYNIYGVKNVGQNKEIRKK